MHQLSRMVSMLVVLGLPPAAQAHAQTLSVAAATGPVFLPGSGASSDWQGAFWLGYQMGPNAAIRLEAMYTGVPGADLVAFTGNLLWIFRRGQTNAIEPYLVVGLGDYVKFSEEQFGLNAGVGVRRRVGAVRLFAEVRYHQVTSRFDEAASADTFVPISFGIMLGR
jgi:hypothetical protein